MIDADLTSVNINDGNSEALNEKIKNNSAGELQLAELLKLKSKINDNKYRSDYSILINDNNDSDRFHTLEKRVITRWNTILVMLRSYTDNVAGVEVILGRLKHYDLMLSTL